MLCARRVPDNAVVEAASAEKKDGPFQCPVCAETAILRKGQLQIHHFAHEPPTECAYGLGESEEHRRCKKEVWESLRLSLNVSDATLEVPLGEVRSDVSAVINGVRVAIEVQLSRLQPETIISRTESYARLGIPVLWLAQWSERLEEERISPRAWELWVHSAYFGRVYYWRYGSTVTPVRYRAVERYVEASDFRNSDGEELSAGGYFRRSKRYREPIIGSELKLTQDFRRQARGEFAGGKLHVPACLLYADRFGSRLFSNL